MNALNPKVSLLIKLAEIVRAHHPFDHISSDPEVLEWYDRMAELEYVPARLGVGLAHQSAVLGQGRGGYQTFAKPRVWPDQEEASYTEAESVQMAMDKCIVQFPLENYIEHGVKDIETQEVTYFRPLESSGDIDSTSLNPPQTGFKGESDPEPLPLGEIEPPPLSLD